MIRQNQRGALGKILIRRLTEWPPVPEQGPFGVTGGMETQIIAEKYPIIDLLVVRNGRTVGGRGKKIRGGELQTNANH